MPFVVSKISDHGSSHPVVARLHLQTSELLKGSTLPQEKRETVFAAYFAAGRRLLRCCDICEDLTQKVETQSREIQAPAGPHGRNMPHVIDLDREVEAFLYEAKNFLRDIVVIFDAFFDAKFDEASALGRADGKGDAKAIAWAEQRFGKNDRLTDFLRKNQQWVAHVIQMRNAVEHPGGKSGRLHVDNFALTGAGVARPCWRLNADPPTPVVEGLRAIDDGLLNYAELMLALSVEKFLSPMVRIVEIPAAERNKQIPARFKFDFTPEFHEKFKRETT